MAKSKRFYSYDTPAGGFWAYRREYKSKTLRRKGFSTKADAESDLRQAMSDIDALERGEVRTKPTTNAEALELFSRKQRVRSVEKSYAYGVHAEATIKRLQESVDSFGPSRLVRELTAEDIKEWMHKTTLRASQSTACTYVGRLMGMLKYAHRTKPDLHNWLPPHLKYEKKIQHCGRVVDGDEYERLVLALLNPQRPDVQKCSRWSMRLRAELWREAADAVRLLRNTGERLNEILRLKWAQVNLAKKTVTLYASKTERDRTVTTKHGDGRASQSTQAAQPRTRRLRLPLRLLTSSTVRSHERAAWPRSKPRFPLAVSTAAVSPFTHSDTPTLRICSLTESMRLP